MPVYVYTGTAPSGACTGSRVWIDAGGTGSYYCNAGTWAAIASGGGGAPTTAGYWTKTAEAVLSNEFAMGTLSTGLVINTTTTGVPTIKAANTCTNQFPRSDTASGLWTCAGVAIADHTATGTPSATTFYRGDNTWSVPAGTYALPDATSVVKGGIQLTGDLGGTAASPTVPGLAGKQAAGSYSGVGACGANTWASTLGASAAPTCTQPGFSNLSGSATAAQIPTASTTLGGVKMAAACAAGNHVASIVAGELTCTADAGGGGGAPTTATYIVQTADAGLSAEQALSSLATGIVKVTTGTGVLSTAVAGDFPALAYLPVGGAAASANLINGAVVTVANHSATGTPSATTFYRGDNTWSTPAGGGVGTLTRLTATWASSAVINTIGVIGTGGVPMTSPSYGAASPFSFRCLISTTRPAITNGPRYGVTFSSAPTRISARVVVGLAAATDTTTKLLVVAAATCATGCSTAMTAGTVAQVMDDVIEGTGVTNLASTISVNMAPSAAAANTAQIGSYCVWY
jgi:hypothetical protein